MDTIWTAWVLLLLPPGLLVQHIQIKRLVKDWSALQKQDRKDRNKIFLKEWRSFASSDTWNSPFTSRWVLSHNQHRKPLPPSFLSSKFYSQETVVSQGLKALDQRRYVHLWCLNLGLGSGCWSGWREVLDKIMPKDLVSANGDSKLGVLVGQSRESTTQFLL